MEAGARSSSSPAGHTSLLCHSVDPWGASARGQKEGSPGMGPGWGWPPACLIHHEKSQEHRDNKPRFNCAEYVFFNIILAGSVFHTWSGNGVVCRGGGQTQVAGAH